MSKFKLKVKTLRKTLESVQKSNLSDKQFDVVMKVEKM